MTTTDSYHVLYVVKHLSDTFTISTYVGYGNEESCDYQLKDCLTLTATSLTFIFDDSQNYPVIDNSEENDGDDAIIRPYYESLMEMKREERYDLEMIARIFAYANSRLYTALTKLAVKNASC